MAPAIATAAIINIATTAVAPQLFFIARRSLFFSAPILSPSFLLRPAVSVSSAYFALGFF
jgi:hypothetical protein